MSRSIQIRGGLRFQPLVETRSGITTDSFHETAAWSLIVIVSSFFLIATGKSSNLKDLTQNIMTRI